jgi:hypothetical protein
MIIIAPPGMKKDLAKQLILDDVFAHYWLVHKDDWTCPDGCDKGADPHRAHAYLRIEVRHEYDLKCEREFNKLCLMSNG